MKIMFNNNTRPFFLLLFLIFFIQFSFGQLAVKDQEKLNGFIEEAKEYLKKNETSKAANSYYKAGHFCITKNQNTTAITYLKESYKLYGEINDLEKVMKIYSTIGLLYANLDQYDKALTYFSYSLKISIQLGNQAQISSSLLDLAYIQSSQQNYKEAILNIIKALDIANEIKNSRLTLISYRMLAENYQKVGNVQKASEYLDKFSSYRQYYEKSETEERVSGERIKSIAELSKKEDEARMKQLEYELSKKTSAFQKDSLNRIVKAREDSLALIEALVINQKKETELLQKQKELDDAQREQDLAQQNINYIIFSSIVAFIILIAIALLFNIRRRKKHNLTLAATNKKIAEQNKNIELKNEELTDAFQKIEEQNKDINSSIDYAVNIQKSLLPIQEELSNYISDSFILFKPRDKVSGDFYWFKDVEISNGTDEMHQKVFVSAIDCTGHGVPGAFLSMMSYNLMDNIIEQKRVYTPGMILDELHNGIRKTLRQRETNNRDGMDMALCSYDPKLNILEFAGAKNPLIYMKNGKMHRVKGDIKPIGGIIHEKSESRKFMNTLIEVDSPTTVYIFSDGFADQIGEETGRKLMTKFFRNLLTEIHQKPMKEQRDILDLFLKKWQGNLEQIDDIIVIGFKLYPNKI